MTDAITIADMEVHSRIGVPDEERAKPQRLLITVEMTINATAAAVDDDIDRTINYHSVYLRVKKLAEDKERQLIETLAEEIAAMILLEFSTDAVAVEIKKFILPNTKHVSVRIERGG